MPNAHDKANEVNGFGYGFPRNFPYGFSFRS